MDWCRGQEDRSASGNSKTKTVLPLSNSAGIPLHHLFARSVAGASSDRTSLPRSCVLQLVLHNKPEDGLSDSDPKKRFGIIMGGIASFPPHGPRFFHLSGALGTRGFGVGVLG